MPLPKTINNYEGFLKEFGLEKNGDMPYMELFFKKKFMVTENKKIIYPKVSDIEEKIEVLEKQIANLKEQIRFWEKEKTTAEKYYKKVNATKYFKKKFWKHKLKQIVNPEYKEDVLNAKLTDEVLMDPAYETLLDTFLVDYDYRKKLSDTVNKSIIYKENRIGDYNKKRQILKTENAKKKIEQLNKQLGLHNNELKSYMLVARFIRQINKN